MRMWIVVILTGILTQLFRVSGLFIPIPRNKFMDKCLEAIPVSVLVVLFFPDIFYSVGDSFREVSLAIIASLLITYLTLKKKDLGKIMLIAVTFVIVFNILLSKFFG